MIGFFIFIFGLLIGSFLNAVIYRLKTKESILITRSHCPKCGALLKWYDLIPLLSFILQKGRCRYCSERISWQYPIVELATGLLFLSVILSEAKNPVAMLIDGRDPSLALRMTFYLLIISFLIIIFVYDLKHYIIPNRIVYPAILVIGVWLLFSGVLPLGRDLSLALKGGLLSVLIAAGFFLFLVLVSKGKWMGLGDVKLAVLMGLVLGWPNILWALFLAFVSGAIIGLGLIAFKNKTIKSQIPFGPFLAGATILVMLFGDNLTKIFNWFTLF